ncbi:hypothetical protein FHR83_008671 [Actinoplanes campanulatus]|uniref:Uncharacterized protein n=1 Tax=Actinoplanes campanulatus TaxID=113559 RepID=A0A7W5FJN6_9ACTN|nr:hypothetical protein [Actinoplanes campanulatus]MBB3100944.1 hypothetical protein [Actinoplanes campanulatus]GGN48875.1 hypothetical protein GCM10010109_86350 [Actinoplanes campanulatus]GID41761.1 hypothetical protein Aca09nite_82670 [Actinoplanes campanulatus]
MTGTKIDATQERALRQAYGKVFDRDADALVAALAEIDAVGAAAAVRLAGLTMTAALSLTGAEKREAAARLAERVSEHAEDWVALPAREDLEAVLTGTLGVGPAPTIDLATYGLTLIYSAALALRMYAEHEEVEWYQALDYLLNLLEK